MLRRMMQDSLWVLGTRLVMRAGNFVVFLILARALGVAEFGFYGWVIATTLVISVGLDLGLRQAGAYAIGQKLAGETEITSALIGAWLVQGTLAVLLTAAAIWWGTDRPGGSAGLLAAALVTAPLLFMRMLQGTFLGLGQVKALNASELAARGFMLATLVPLWLGGGLDLESALWALLAAQVMAALVLLWQLRGRIAVRALVRPALVGQLMAHGLPFMAGVVGLILFGRVGIWVTGAVLSAEDLGHYVANLRMTELMAEIATAVGVVLFSHGVRSADPARAARDAVQVARCLLALMAAGAVLTALVAEPLLRIVLGAAYAAEVASFRVLLLGTVPGCLAMMLFPSLTAQGRAGLAALIFAPAVVLHGLLAWALAPALGLEGAAIAYVVCQLLVAGSLVVAFHRLYGIGWHEALLVQREDVRRAGGVIRRRLAGGAQDR